MNVVAVVDIITMTKSMNTIMRKNAAVVAAVNITIMNMKLMSSIITMREECGCGCGHHHHHDEEHEHHHDHKQEHEHHHHDEECECGCGCGHHHHHDEEHEHHHEAVEHESCVMPAGVAQKTYILENLGCANCAAKMERKIQALPEVEGATLTYATKKLVVASDHQEHLLSKIQEICSSIESEVQVVAMPDDQPIKREKEEPV